MIYKPKHHKPHPTTKRLLQAPKWIWGELVWYCNWWINLFVSFFNLLYQFGEWILQTGTTLIDLHDKWWDNIEEHIKEIHRNGMA